MLADVDRRATIFATEREVLGETEADQNDRRNDADRGVRRQQPDEESADAHERHRDDERVFAADEVPEPAEEEGAERTLAPREWAPGCRRYKSRTTRILCRAKKRR
jgi:hypothetical protein